MSRQLKRERIRRGIDAQDVAQAIRRYYPKYDRAMQSKVERPDDYGIKLLAHAEEIAREYIGLPAKKSDKRRFQNRLYLRLPDDEYIQFREAMVTEGYDTDQDYMRMIIRYYMARRQNKNEC